MKYYLIAGEASGDLHASHLMKELKKQDAKADFRFYGGDQMQMAGGTLVKHYRELAYMGFVPVLLHLPTIMKNMRRAKQDIIEWHPDVLILIDYPGFNLKIAKYVKKHTQIPVYYYISPKIWAWKEYRIKNIKRDVDKLFSILPFEVEFFEQKHHFPIHYVGNPTADEVREFIKREKGKVNCEKKAPEKTGSTEDNSSLFTIHSSHKTIALLCGSRKQEISINLPAMLQATDQYSDSYRIVIAGAPAIEPEYYRQFTENHKVTIVFQQTYQLLSEAHAALVTSGTATLETALFGVPQVVCYKMPMPRFYGWLRKLFLKVKYVSLVNLIADREVVHELVADSFTQQRLEQELAAILPADSPVRQQIIEGYEEVVQRLGNEKAPQNAASIMLQLLRKEKDLLD